MPQYAYLIPFVLLFGIGAPAAVIVTFVYAMPAAIRITALGIRGVPTAPIEAAQSLGATGGQVLRKVRCSWRKTIGLAVNQTIMLALSMVVITVVIDGRASARDIIKAIQTLNVGAIFDAGLAIVILAIILDRVTEQASLRLDPRAGGTPSRTDRRNLPRRWVIGGLGLASLGAVALGAVAPDWAGAFPEEFATLTFRAPVNDIVHWIQANLYSHDRPREAVVTAGSSSRRSSGRRRSGSSRRRRCHGGDLSGKRAAVITIVALAGPPQLWITR
jgi:glycine betaine/proline transport system permease protein